MRRELQELLKEINQKLTGVQIVELLRECRAYFDMEEYKNKIHVILASGLHTNRFYDLELALEHQEVCEHCTMLLIKGLGERNLLSKFNVLVGPAMGAHKLLQALAMFLPIPKLRTILVEKKVTIPQAAIIHELDQFYGWVEWKDSLIISSPAEILKGIAEVKEKIRSLCEAAAREVYQLPKRVEIGPDDSALFVDDVYTTGATFRVIRELCHQRSRKLHEGADTNLVGMAVCINRSTAHWSQYEHMPTLPLVFLWQDPLTAYTPEDCNEYGWCRDGIQAVKGKDIWDAVENL